MKSRSESSGDDEQSSLSGWWFAVMAAVGYSAANLALRGLTGRAGVFWDFWVQGIKGVPTVVAAVWLLWRQHRRSSLTLPGRGALPALLGATLLMQFGGNVGFQMALGRIGLAVTVPIVFACIIAAGAVLGRIVLGDPLTRRSLISVGLMMAAIVLSSMSAGENAPTDIPAAGDRDSAVSSPIWVGVLLAVVSGCSYGTNGVVIRRFVRNRLPVESTLIVYSTMGLLMLTPIGGIGMGWEGVTSISSKDWLTMLAAGLFNTVAFFAISHAFRQMNVTRVNVINSSQNVMCAAGAALLFGEAISRELGLAVVLTILGLLVLDSGREGGRSLFSRFRRSRSD